MNIDQAIEDAKINYDVLSLELEDITRKLKAEQLRIKKLEKLKEQYDELVIPAQSAS